MTADQIYQYMQFPEKLDAETLPFLRELTEQHPAFETGWILYLKNLKNLNDSSFDQELLHGAIRIQDRRRLYLFLNSNKKEIVVQPLPPKTNITEDPVYNLFFPAEFIVDPPIMMAEPPMGDVARSIQKKPNKRFGLIEKFIEAQPKMPPAKELASLPPTEIKKPKDPESEDLVTETLASIYAHQGYYKKAIQIFEKLSLKYPEKNTYFAGQIEKIKNLMNN